jgi:hypothetical protein
MPLSKKIELAHAKRVLKRIEEDATRFRLRLADLPPEAQSIAIEQFKTGLQKQERRVRDLETQIDSD